MNLLLEGDDLEALLIRARREGGPFARIVRAEKVRRGGVLGFFAKEGFEVAVEVPGGLDDEDELKLADRPGSDDRADRLARAQRPAPPRLPRSGHRDLLNLAQQAGGGNGESIEKAAALAMARQAAFEAAMASDERMPIQDAHHRDTRGPSFDPYGQDEVRETLDLAEILGAGGFPAARPPLDPSSVRNLGAGHPSDRRTPLGRDLPPPRPAGPNSFAWDEAEWDDWDEEFAGFTPPSPAAPAALPAEPADLEQEAARRAAEEAEAREARIAARAEEIRLERAAKAARTAKAKAAKAAARKRTAEAKKKSAELDQNPVPEDAAVAPTPSVTEAAGPVEDAPGLDTLVEGHAVFDATASDGGVDNDAMEDAVVAETAADSDVVVEDAVVEELTDAPVERATGEDTADEDFLDEEFTAEGFADEDFADEIEAVFADDEEPLDAIAPSEQPEHGNRVNTPASVRTLPESDASIADTAEVDAPADSTPKHAKHAKAPVSGTTSAPTRPIAMSPAATGPIDADPTATAADLGTADADALAEIAVTDDPDAADLAAEFESLVPESEEAAPQPATTRPAVDKTADTVEMPKVIEAAATEQPAPRPDVTRADVTRADEQSSAPNARTKPRRRHGAHPGTVGGEGAGTDASASSSPELSHDAPAPELADLTAAPGLDDAETLPELTHTTIPADVADAERPATELAPVPLDLTTAASEAELDFSGLRPAWARSRGRKNTPRRESGTDLMLPASRRSPRKAPLPGGLMTDSLPGIRVETTDQPPFGGQPPHNGGSMPLNTGGVPSDPSPVRDIPKLLPLPPKARSGGSGRGREDDPARTPSDTAQDTDASLADADSGAPAEPEASAPTVTPFAASIPGPPEIEADLIAKWADPTGPTATPNEVPEASVDWSFPGALGTPADDPSDTATPIGGWAETAGDPAPTSGNGDASQLWGAPAFGADYSTDHSTDHATDPGTDAVTSTVPGTEPFTTSEETPRLAAPEFTTPGFSTPGFSTSGHGSPESGEPEFSAPSFGTPEFQAPEFGTADAAASDTAPVTFGAPESAWPGFGTPELAAPGIGTTEPATPEPATPGFGTAETAAPGFGTDETATPGFGTVEPTPPGFGTADLATSAFGAAGSGTAGFGTPGTDETGIPGLAGAESPYAGSPSFAAETPRLATYEAAPAFGAEPPAAEMPQLETTSDFTVPGLVAPETMSSETMSSPATPSEAASSEPVSSGPVSSGPASSEFATSQFATPQFTTPEPAAPEFTTPSFSSPETLESSFGSTPFGSTPFGSTPFGSTESNTSSFGSTDSSFGAPQFSSPVSATDATEYAATSAAQAQNVSVPGDLAELTDLTELPATSTRATTVLPKGKTRRTKGSKKTVPAPRQSEETITPAVEPAPAEDAGRHRPRRERTSARHTGPNTDPTLGSPDDVTEDAAAVVSATASDTEASTDDKSENEAENAGGFKVFGIRFGGRKKAKSKDEPKDEDVAPVTPLNPPAPEQDETSSAAIAGIPAPRVEASSEAALEEPPAWEIVAARASAAAAAGELAAAQAVMEAERASHPTATLTHPEPQASTQTVDQDTQFATAQPLVPAQPSAPLVESAPVSEGSGGAPSAWATTPANHSPEWPAPSAPAPGLPDEGPASSWASPAEAMAAWAVPVAETPVTETPVTEAPVAEAPVAESTPGFAPPLPNPMEDAGHTGSPEPTPGSFPADDFQVPGFAAPGFAAPGFAAPAIETPSPSAPIVASPDYAAPDLTTPDFATPALETPGLATPGLAMPAAEEPVTAWAFQPDPEPPVSPEATTASTIDVNPAIESPLAPLPLPEAGASIGFPATESPFVPVESVPAPTLPTEADLQAAAEQAVAADRAALNTLGVPAEWTANLPSGDRFMAVVQMLGAMPEPTIADDVEVIAVVGPSDIVGLEAARTALDLPHNGGPRTVVTVPHELGPERSGAMDLAAATRPVVVSIPVDGARTEDAGKIRKVLQNVGAEAVIAVLDGSRSLEENQRWVRYLGKVDAVALDGALDSGAPAEVLQLGLPVVRVDGIAVDRVGWAALLCTQLAVGGATS